jgi:hypothetical protein
MLLKCTHMYTQHALYLVVMHHVDVQLGRILKRIGHTLPLGRGTHTLPCVFLAYFQTLNKPFPSRQDASSSAQTCLLRLCNHKPHTFATHFAGHNVLMSCGWRIPTYSALAEKAHEKMHAQGVQGCAMAATDSASNQLQLQNFQALQTCLEEEMHGRVPAPRWAW